jgi:putative transposase
MKKQRFTEEQIIGVLREQEVGAKAADLCRKHGISEATFYNWKVSVRRTHFWRVDLPKL